jgi:hypothetical protein
MSRKAWREAGFRAHFHALANTGCFSDAFHQVS